MSWLLDRVAAFLRENPNSKNVATGVAIGLSDIALFYPFAVIATRRECGLTMVEAIAQRNFWSGGWTCGTMLVPYSALVEGGSNYLKVNLQSEIAATAITTAFATLGMQIIEKKLTMDQMLEKQPVKTSSPLLRPFLEIRQYVRINGIRPLFAGTLPLMCREGMYISAITVVNPFLTRYTKERFDGAWVGPATAFCIGLTVGFLTAPFQTVSAMLKYDHNKGMTTSGLLRRVFAPGLMPGEKKNGQWHSRRRMANGIAMHTEQNPLTHTHLPPPSPTPLSLSHLHTSSPTYHMPGLDRLWYGAATRSFRIGRVVDCRLYSTPYTHTPCTMRYAPCTIHHAPYTMHHAPCTIHHAPCTIHHAPCTLHHAGRICAILPYTVLIHHTLYTMHRAGGAGLLYYEMRLIFADFVGIDEEGTAEQ
jgi:hypothetical protein